MRKLYFRIAKHDKDGHAKLWGVSSQLSKSE